MPAFGVAKPIKLKSGEERAEDQGRGYVYFPRGTVILYPGNEPFRIVRCLVEGPPYYPFAYVHELEMRDQAFGAPAKVLEAARVVLDYFGSAGSQQAYG